jgi:hypothetical protein
MVEGPPDGVQLRFVEDIVESGDNIDTILGNFSAVESGGSYLCVAESAASGLSTALGFKGSSQHLKRRVLRWPCHQSEI